MPGRSSRFVALAFAASLAPLGAARAAPQDEELVEVSGTVVVEDGKGGTVDDESGTIVVNVHEGSGWRPQNVFLIEGQWKTKVPATCQLSFEVFKLDGGIAAWLLEGEKAPPAGKRRFEDPGPRERGLPIPKERRLAVRARFVPPCRVHVFDATTDAELTHVVAVLDVYHDEVHSSIGNRHALGELQIHPTPWWKADLRASDSASPLALSFDMDGTFPSWSEDLWVHAPGYCWAGVAVDYRVGGDTTVKLARGGTLTVNVESERLPEGTKIVVRKGKAPAKAPTADRPADEAADESAEEPSDDDDESSEDDESVSSMSAGADGKFSVDFNGFSLGSSNVCAEWPFAPGRPTTFDALPPGDYRVSLEIGERYGKRQTFAATDVTVKLDATATALLRVANAPKIPEPVALRGTIRIDPGWGDVAFDVFVRPVEVSPLLPQRSFRLDRRELRRDPADPALWKLPERKVAPGSYQLGIDEFGVDRTLVVLRASKPIAIEIGPPIEATFHFVDAKTKAPLAVEEPTWSCVDPDALASDSFEGVTFHSHFARKSEPKASDTHTLRVPAGRISLSVRLEDYDQFTPVLLDVSEDEAEFTVPFRHMTGVRILVRIDGKPISWDDAVREGTKGTPKAKEDFFDVEPTLRPRGADASDQGATGWGQSRDGRYLTVEHSGSYTVSLPELAAFEPVAPRDVTVADQEFTEVVFELVRKKK
jgi:hypothetical protein